MPMSEEAIAVYRSVVVPGDKINPEWVSSYQQKFKNDVELFLRQQGVDCTIDTKIGEYTYDFCIESMKTLIMCADTFRIASVGPGFRDEDKSYLMQKWFFTARDHGYRLIALEDEVWYKRGERIKDVLKYAVHPAKYHIYGRKCEVRQIPSEMAKAFLLKYHVDGSSGLASVHLGLFKKEDETKLENLLQVTTWSGMRMGRGRKDEWELARMSVNPDYCVVGGTSKFFDYFIKLKHPSYIHSYSANTWFLGSGYDKVGMLEVNQTVPSYGWIRFENGLPVRCAREKVQCKKFRVAYPEVIEEIEANRDKYPSGLENAFCVYMGWYRTANSGNTAHALYIDYDENGRPVYNNRKERLSKEVE